MTSANHLLPHMQENKDLFQCPACGGELLIQNDISCCLCGRHYPVQDRIPLLFLPNDWNGKTDVTEKIKSFYEKNPFPNYDDIDNISVLINKAERGLFAKMLDQQIPINAKVLEVGCGTGQLSNYLGISYRTLFGTDLCLNSLRLANDFKIKNNLNRVGFYQMNLFRPIFKEESFDLVICNGVLHHTSNPYGGFQSVARLVKKDGYILLGLYNKFGRFVTDIRRVIFFLFKDNFKFLDPYLRRRDIGDKKKLTWFMDQYKNPHESKHTIGEVLNWFDTAGFELQSGIPSPSLDLFGPNFRLFEKHERGNKFSHGLVQLQLIFTGSREGGFFILIGKKNKMTITSKITKLNV